MVRRRNGSVNFNSLLIMDISFQIRRTFDWWVYSYTCHEINIEVNLMKKENIHSSIALMIPFAGNDDSNRRQMSQTHLAQGVPIKWAETPRILTQFASNIIKDSVEYVTVNSDTKVIGEYELFGDTFLLVHNLEKNYLDIIDVENKREGFTAYTSNKTTGDKLSKGDVLSYTESDEGGIPKLGYNTNVAFMMNGDNFEDSFVVSDAFTQKMTHKSTKIVDFIVNSGTFLLNLFGDEDSYQPFPLEAIDPSNNILCCSRIIDNRDFLTNLHRDKLSTMMFTDIENLRYGKGRIVSIDVIRNKINSKDPNTGFDQGSRFEESMDLYEDITQAKINDFLTTVLSFDTNVTDILNEKLKYYNKILGDSSLLLFNGNKYKGWYIKIKLESEVPLKIGSKISNFHGTKGLITKILPESSMPIFPNGERVEVYVNPNTVIGRMNTGQISEILLNKLSDYFFGRIMEAETLNEKKSIYFEYMSDVLERNIDNYTSDLITMDFFDDLRKTGYLIAMVDVSNYPNLIQLVRKYGITVMDYLTKSDGTQYRSKCLFGSNYYIKLKHEPEKKSSVASFGKVDEQDFLVKSSDLKKNKSIIGNVPAAMGEMELTALLPLPDGHLLREFIYLRGGGKKLRERFSMKLLTQDDVTINDFEYEKHLALLGMENYLKVLGVQTIPKNNS